MDDIHRHPKLCPSLRCVMRRRKVIRVLLCDASTEGRQCFAMWREYGKTLDFCCVMHTRKHLSAVQCNTKTERFRCFAVWCEHWKTRVLCLAVYILENASALRGDLCSSFDLCVQGKTQSHWKEFDIPGQNPRTVYSSIPNMSSRVLRQNAYIQEYHTGHHALCLLTYPEYSRTDIQGRIPDDTCWSSCSVPTHRHSQHKNNQTKTARPTTSADRPHRLWKQEDNQLNTHNQQYVMNVM